MSAGPPGKGSPFDYLGEALVLLRTFRGLTQAELAAYSNGTSR